MASDRSAASRDLTAVAIRNLSRTGSDREAEPVPLGGMADRVSISSRSTADLRSAYSGGMTSQSRVTRAGEEVSTAATARVVQDLASGILGRDVAVTGADPVPGRSASFAGPGRTGVPGAGTRTLITETRIHFEEEQVGFSSRGEVRTADGRVIGFSLDLSMNRSVSLETHKETLIQARPVTLTDPLVISLDGLPPRLTDTRFSFDLDADGGSDEISFVSSGSGFLALDRNGDGKINDGSELFGPASGDGFQDLAVHDQDNNGWIDEDDEVFSQLSVWTRDDDGRDRVISLAEAGVGAIFLGSAATSFDLKGEDNRMLGRVAASGMFLFEDGRAGLVQEIDLAVEEPIENTPALSGLASRNGPPMGGLPLFSRASGPVTTGGASPPSPFKALQDALDDLKEEMRLLLEGRRSGPEKNAYQGSL